MRGLVDPRKKGSVKFEYKCIDAKNHKMDPNVFKSKRMKESDFTFSMSKESLIVGDNICGILC